MKRIAAKLLEYIPDFLIFNWFVIILQSLIYHKTPFYLFTKGLNAYILRSKIKSHHLSNFADKISAKDEIRCLIGRDIAPATISIVDDVENIVLPPGDWIFKSSHNCSGGIILKNGRLSCAKKIYLETPINNPSIEIILKVLKNFSRSNNSKNLFWTTREACYKALAPRYFFEELLVDGVGEFFSEYKFHCINGKVELVYLVVDRHGNNKRAILNRYCSQLKASWCKRRDLYKFENNTDYIIPANWDDLICISELIANHFKYVRVDLYTDGKEVKIGELTFFHGSGLEPITPSSIDIEFGKMLL